MITAEELGGLFGKFSWNFGRLFFIETSKGNFVWSDPGFNGTGEIWPVNETLAQYAKGQQYRDKGRHQIDRYCGDFKLVKKRSKP